MSGTDKCGTIRVSLLFTEVEGNKIVETDRHVSSNKVTIYLLGHKNRIANYQISKIPVFYIQIVERIIPTASYSRL